MGGGWIDEWEIRLHEWRVKYLCAQVNMTGFGNFHILNYVHNLW